jgi:hypothetical protein
MFIQRGCCTCQRTCRCACGSPLRRPSELLRDAQRPCCTMFTRPRAPAPAALRQPASCSRRLRRRRALILLCIADLQGSMLSLAPAIVTVCCSTSCCISAQDEGTKAKDLGPAASAARAEPHHLPANRGDLVHALDFNGLQLHKAVCQLGPPHAWPPPPLPPLSPWLPGGPVAGAINTCVRAVQMSVQQ